MTRRPRTGEPRRVHQPLNIDRLPQSMRDRILHERNTECRTWDEIEQDSPGWPEWKDVPEPIAILFPEGRLPRTSVHRWYDLRYAQVQKEAVAKAVQSRELAAVFAKAAVDGDDDAVLNAARDLIFGMLGQGDAKAQMSVAKGLLSLGEVMQIARANSIKERKVAIDERRVIVAEKKLAQIQGKVKELREEIAKKEVNPQLLQQRIDEIYGISA